MVIPAGQESLQHTSSRGFSDRDRTGDTDDEGHLTIGMLLAEEGRGGREQSLACRHLQVDQTCEGEINLGNFFEIDLLAETTQAVQLVLGQHQWRRLTQCPPLLAVELDVGTRFVGARHQPSSPARSEPGGPADETAMRASQARVRTIRVHSRIVLGATSGTFAGWHSGASD